MLEELQKKKTMIRRQMLLRRSALSEQEVAAADCSGAVLAERLLMEKSPNIVAVYWSIHNEFSTRGMIQCFRQNGVTLALPVISSMDKLEFFVLNSPEELRLGKYDIPVPPTDPDNWIEPARIDLMIVPGVAFDREGRRLGMGKGYYDRYLKLIHPDTLTVGVAYEFQLIAKVPTYSSDHPVQRLWTDSGRLFSPKGQEDTSKGNHAQ